MNTKLLAALLFLWTVSYVAKGQQVIGGWKDERALYAETKQVNQFFLRFNNEETVSGTRLYSKKDSAFRDPKGRAKYIKLLFDNENPSISKEIKNTFITDVTNKSKPSFLDFHGGKWLAEVITTFNYKGKEEQVTMFMNIQEEKVGSKWVINRVKYVGYDKLYIKDTTNVKDFLHPLSHEVDFMNLHKVFENHSSNLYSYTADDYHPDHLTLFINDVKNGNMKFNTVKKVKFHFFQINNWYFELQEFNRSGNNTGWLISSITKANEKEKAQIEQFIFNKNE